MSINLDKENLKNKLKELGAPEDRLDQIIDDIGIVILNKVTLLVLAKLTDEQRSKLETMPQENVGSYLEDIRDQIEYPSEEELGKIYQDVWNAYSFHSAK